MSKSQPQVGDVFDLDRIRRLIELMKEHDLSEIDLQQEEQRIRLSRGMSPAGTSFAPVPAAPVATAAPAAPAAAASTAPDEANIVLIRSPMVGTFYSRANPKSEPFVRVGDHVDEDKTVCVIEAMKVFNEIPAEVRGRIVAVLVSDEDAVEFGKPLFKVDTSK
jgi:acetyl-CoA carboxylase biotin carboxyl carrier protein